MSSVNKVILVGNLGADPEVRYTNGGQAVASIRLATTESWTDKEGQKQERTEWHQISVWGKQAEFVAQYMTKGRQAYVEGRLQTREYTDKEGIVRKVWEIQADRVNALGGPGRDGDGASGGGGPGGGGASSGGGNGGAQNNRGPQGGGQPGGGGVRAGAGQPGNRGGGGGGGGGNRGGGGGGGGNRGGGAWDGAGGGGGNDPIPF